MWPGEPADCLDHKRFAVTLKKIGFEGDICTMEGFRPDYYKLSNEKNIARPPRLPAPMWRSTGKRRRRSREGAVPMLAPKTVFPRHCPIG